MVRGEMGLKNVEIMILFVRTLDMAKDVNEVLASRLVNRRFRGLKDRQFAAGVTRNHDSQILSYFFNRDAVYVL